MDTVLRCNSLKCRIPLHDRAVVTTCSHIFCIGCAETLSLSGSTNGARTCPACETQLSNPDDVVVTQLNPTEDYKTSVLSGLSPSTILECASRGLSFYTYQTSQEIIYQEFLSRSLTDKYSTLNSQMDKVIHDANAEITSMRDRLSALHLEKKDLEQKNLDLQKAFKDKAKSQQQLSRMYQTLKQQQVAAGMEFAAEHDAEHTLQTLGRAAHTSYNTLDSHVPHSRAGSNGSGGDRGAYHSGHRGWNAGADIPGASRGSPLGHRTPLPGRVDSGKVMNPLNNPAALGQRTPRRQPLNSIDPNLVGRSTTGYGISAGVKIGRPNDSGSLRNGFAGGRGLAAGGFNGTDRSPNFGHHLATS